jgi:hypothetical protein
MGGTVGGTMGGTGIMDYLLNVLLTAQQCPASASIFQGCFLPFVLALHQG